MSALDDAGVSYTVRRYLDDPPTAAELSEILARLGLEPWDITADEGVALVGRSDDAVQDAIRRSAG